MERTAGDPKNAEPGDKSAAEYQKTAVPGDKGSESLSRGSDDKRVPPPPHLPHDASVGRSGSDDNKRGSGSRSAESEARPRSRLCANAPEFIPQARAPSVTPSPPRAPEFIPRPQAPPVTPPPHSAPEFNPRVRAPPVTPPPPRVDATGGFRTPSPSPTPPTPLSIGSRSSSDSSSGPQPRPQQRTMQGFSAVAKHGSGMKLEMEKRKQQMLQYLNSDDCDYIDQATNLGRKLTVDFEDLLQKNRVLGIQICKDRGSNTTWLDEACKTFFESKQLPADGVTFTFANIPSRLQEATDFMQSKDCTEGRAICSNTSYIETATEHGREVTDLVMNRILDNVADKGISWDGKLGLGDILFGETVDGQVKVYIAKSPVYKSSAPTQPRLADLKSIWPMIEEGCRLSQSNLPLYFSELKSDLNNATHLSDWFIKYLRFHPALYGPTPRRYFVTSLQMLTRRTKLVEDKDYGSLFSVQPLPDGDDWRSIASDGPLKKLLNYKFPGGQKDPNNKKTSQYENNTGSLLDYVKNGLSHLAQYISVIDDDEVELFLALKFPKLLPDIMKGILVRGGMHDKFAACWKAYRNTK